MVTESHIREPGYYWILLSLLLTTSQPCCFKGFRYSEGSRAVCAGWLQLCSVLGSCSMHLALLFSPHRMTSFRSYFSFSRTQEHFEILKKALLWQRVLGIVTCLFILQGCYSSLKPCENSQSLSCVQLYLLFGSIVFSP